MADPPQCLCITRNDPAAATRSVQDCPACGTPMADLSETGAAELREKFRAAQATGKTAILPADTDQRIAEAVTAERERCARLIKARYHIADGEAAAAVNYTLREILADLLRKDDHAAT